MTKKLSLLFAFICFSFSLNAFDFLSGPAAAQADSVLTKIQASQTKTPSYLLEPIYFIITPSASAQNAEQANITPSQCYAVVLNAKWLLTHKDCFKPAVKGVRSFTFNFKNKKYNAAFYGTQKEVDYDIDDQSGAVVLNMRKITLANCASAPTLADLIQKNDDGRFKKRSNYATIILMSVTPKEARDYYFKNVIAKATFSAPTIKEPVKVKTQEGLSVTLDMQDNSSLPGEPLYMNYKTGNKIMVGFNTAPKGEERKVAIFGVGFTRIMHFTMWNTAAQMIIVSDLCDIILPFPPSA